MTAFIKLASIITLARLVVAGFWPFGEDSDGGDGGGVDMSKLGITVCHTAFTEAVIPLAGVQTYMHTCAPPKIDIGGAISAFFEENTLKVKEKHLEVQKQIQKQTWEWVKTCEEKYNEIKVKVDKMIKIAQEEGQREEEKANAEYQMEEIKEKAKEAASTPAPKGWGFDLNINGNVNMPEWKNPFEGIVDKAKEAAQKLMDQVNVQSQKLLDAAKQKIEEAKQKAKEADEKVREAHAAVTEEVKKVNPTKVCTFGEEAQKGAQDAMDKFNAKTAGEGCGDQRAALEKQIADIEKKADEMDEKYARLYSMHGIDFQDMSGVTVVAALLLFCVCCGASVLAALMRKQRRDTMDDPRKMVLEGPPVDEEAQEALE